MKKLSYFSMAVAALLLGACTNAEPLDPGTGGTGTGTGGSGYVEPAGDGTEANPYNVSAALAHEMDGTEAWVKGFIVGQVAGSDISAESQFGPEFTGATYDDGTVAKSGTNLLIAASNGESTPSACLVVQLPAGEIRDALNLVNHPENDSVEVVLKGKIEKYFGVHGLKSVTTAKFNGQTIGEAGGGGDPVLPGDAKGDGTKDNPYNVAAAKAQNNSGANAWVKAYIVGHVAGSSLNEESQFGPTFTGATYDDGTVATEGTNLLIADKADETNPANCFVIQLPKGDIRTALNLVTNPGNDSKEVALYGKLEKYFGANGLKSVTGAIFEGQTLGEGGNDPGTGGDPTLPGDATGDGTQNNPFNVVAAKAQNNSGATAWVKAFIVGQVAGMSLSGSEFDAPFSLPSADATQGTNILIADNANETNPDNCLAIQLPTGAIRNGLNLVDNPGNDSKEVILYGKLEKYFGANGLKSVSAAIIDGTTLGTIPTDVTGAILNETFLGSLGGFTTYNVSGDQVWEADAQYGAKMSGYADGASHANEDWLLSPAVDLTGKSGVIVIFDHAINKGELANLKTNHTMWISDNYNGGDPAAATWEEVAITTYPDGTSWTYVSSGEIAIPAAYLKANVTIAFKYLCSDEESATWEIKNFVMK